MSSWGACRRRIGKGRRRRGLRRPRRGGLQPGACRYDPELVFDLSGEPVVEPAERLGSRAPRSHAASRTREPTSASILLCWNRSRGPRSPSSERGSESGRPRSRAISPASSRSSARWSSWRWGAAGRAEPQLIESPPTLDDPAVAVQGRPARRIRLPGDRRPGRRAHDRVPAVRRRSRRAVATSTSPRSPPGRGARAGSRGLRRKRRRRSARARTAASSYVGARTSRRAEPIPGPDLRSRVAVGVDEGAAAASAS